MSYIYVPSGSSGATDRLVVARRMADVMSPYDVGGAHAWGIASGSGDAPIVSQTTGSFMEAFADSLLNSVGLQLQSNNVLGSNSTNSSVFSDVGANATITFTAPVAKTYVVSCDFGLFSSTAAGGFIMRLIVNGTTGPTINAYMPVANFIQPYHLQLAAPCAVGANTVKVQWAIVSAITLNVNGNSYANYIITG